MKVNPSLNLVYSFQNLNSLDLDEMSLKDFKILEDIDVIIKSASYYQIIYFFSDNETINFDSLVKVYESFSSNKLPDRFFDSKVVGPFSSIEDLKGFALEVCDKLKSPDVFMMAAEEYNASIESVVDKKELKVIFKRFGRCLENPNLKKSRKNIFKFFK
jgi:hypothetical protein